ncbi:MAG: LL-diaminopimelate aminotransferase [Chlamydiae bacterium]|nr:LL-diaminopimelate aminotransferase [Chlamydiota bacterium]
MSKINPYFQQLDQSYIFSLIEEKVEQANHMKMPIINLGIGDVSLPLSPKIVEALCEATCEMGTKKGMRGYGPSQGYPFLREAIQKNEYADFKIDSSEIFISDGINSDAVNIQDLFEKDASIAIEEPTYPAYLQSCIIGGWKKKIHFLSLTEENQFQPTFPEQKVDWIYLCSPNNPTGVALNRKQLSSWVGWARKNGSIILYDNAYAAFITSSDVPKTIYEIEGAKEVAIEMRSFSKSAGFTGLRCSYMVIPKTLFGYCNREKISLHSLWQKRQAIKFNGLAYPIQKAAEATFSKEAKVELQKQIATYQKATSILREGLTKIDQTFFGGIDSPYIFWKIPPSFHSSWEFFDWILEECQIIAVPGIGFGKLGEGFLRLSGFTTPEIAVEVIKRVLKSVVEIL